MIESALPQQRRSPWLAGLGNFIGAPLGHIYAGQAKRGIRLLLAEMVLLTAAVYLAAQPVGKISILALCLAGLFGGIGLIIDAFRVARRQGSAYRLKRYNCWYVYLASYVALWIIEPTLFESIRTNVVQGYYIPAASMTPTLLLGDRILSDHLTLRRRPPHRGEIVVFRAPPQASFDENDFVKRVIGLAGDTVAVEPDAVTVDGKVAVQMINTDATGEYSSFLRRQPRGLAVERHSEAVSEAGALVLATPDGGVPVVASPTGRVTFQGRRVLVDGVARATLPASNLGRVSHSLAAFGAAAGVTGSVVLNGEEPALIVLKGTRLALRPGRVVVNGQALQESYVEQAPRYEMPPHRVPAGHLFVLGDNRNDSNDSHAWGPLDQKRVSGVVHTLYFSWDDTTETVRWGRIGTHPK